MEARSNPPLSQPQSSHPGIRHLKGLGYRYRYALITAPFVMGIWQLVGSLGWLPISVPSPWQIGVSLIGKFDVLWHHVQPTILASVLGFTIATAVALTLAILATLIPKTEPVIYGASVFIFSVPLIALTPVLVIWMGTGAAVRITIATIAGFFPILVAGIQGFKAVDAGAMELFQILSADRWQRFVHLQWPSALPYLFSGLKAAAASAVLGTIISEWTGADRGLGVMMVYALFAFDAPQLWVTILSSGALSVLGYGLVVLVERWLTPWQEGRIDG